MWSTKKQNGFQQKKYFMDQWELTDPGSKQFQKKLYVLSDLSDGCKAQKTVSPDYSPYIQ
jgi:hypothetical protein